MTFIIAILINWIITISSLGDAWGWHVEVMDIAFNREKGQEGTHAMLFG